MELIIKYNVTLTNIITCIKSFKITFALITPEQIKHDSN